MKLIGALLVRNEADPSRYLRRSLQNAKQWCDAVVVLDDRSEDDTAAICREEGAFVVTRESDTPAWGNEAPARKELWDLSVLAAQDYRAWVYFFDADHELSADPRPLLVTEHLNTWVWPLFDLWDDEYHYRCDGKWKAHLTPRPWLVKPDRVPEGWVAEWNQRGIHCGHLPHNWPMMGAVAPRQYYIRHLGYIKSEHREAKQAKYLSVANQLSPFEAEHAMSICDRTSHAA